jgi:hypothetical protein
MMELGVEEKGRDVSLRGEFSFLLKLLRWESVEEC